MTAIPLAVARGYALAAGFNGNGLDTILAIARAESGLPPDYTTLNPLATNTANNTPPSTDRGILQINSYWHSEVTDAQAFDPAWSFRWAYPQTAQGTDFHQWATYTGGAYLRFMPQGGAPTVTTLPNFPHKDQRSEATSDGRPPENGNYDCVPTSFAAAIQYFDGGYVNGDELKDDSYGEAYANAGTAMSQYVDSPSRRARAVYHVTADAENGDPGALVALIHSGVAGGFPVIATIPSAWGSTRAQLGWSDPANPGGFTHVVAFFAEDGGAHTLTAMNPWGGFDHSGSDQYWADRLCMNQVWKVHKEGPLMADGQPTGYYGLVQTNDPQVWSCPSTSSIIGHGFLAHYQHLVGANGTNATEILGLPISNEYGWNGVVRQDFERGYLLYDPKGTGAWSIFHGPAGADLKAAGQKISQLNDQVTGLNTQHTADQAALGQANAQVATLTAEVATLKAQTVAVPQALRDALAKLAGDADAMDKLGLLPQEAADIRAALAALPAA